MASINQLVSEIAHSIQQPNSIPVRRAIKEYIYYARNEFIRRSFERHNYVDKVLEQRIKLSLEKVNDGDIPAGDYDSNIPKILRTVQKVPRSTRLTNNLPFLSVRTIGVTNPIEIPFVKEASSKFYKSLPGFCPKVTYDYINERIYINPLDGELNDISAIVVESIFERPDVIRMEDLPEGTDIDDDEFLLPEDMIPDITIQVLRLLNGQIVRETEEVTPQTNAQ